jgi:hypothetical protein
MADPHSQAPSLIIHDFMRFVGTISVPHASPEVS